LGELAVELSVELAGGIVGDVEEPDDAWFLSGQGAQECRQHECGGDARDDTLEARPIHIKKMEIESRVRQVGFQKLDSSSARMADARFSTPSFR
jgi:hypothetical protein